ncbi:hypothetical protein K466DRAFT_492051 [Polyporus arcularius HHB13444]|uniref:KOW domain-containing protein n=2 Tax=Polyporaceae TaxID=5317 RepID=A0A5C3PAU1_9APHY|nr:hypothetical protein OH76DRAFT_1553773 [Polyporus brumalis]TFK86824.1 hypothetical protein K466DRAFT_492051 [Polyporus arcularius HHB13444]
MPITARELSYAAKTQVFTRNFRHLLPVPRFLVRGPFMHGQSKPKDTKPKDRIKFWNIVPGDFVKLRNDSKGTVHEVHKINKLSNRVILKREINKANYVPDARSGSGVSVPYSQCQLLVGKYEYPPEGSSTEPKVQNVFATRITSSEPYFNRKGGYWIWRRYAVNTTPRLPSYSADKFSSIRIPWPKTNAVTRPDPSPYDTTADVVNEVTYTPPSLPSTLLSPAPRVPSEHEYITSLSKPEKVSLPKEAPVEVYLHKELSNPHARAKKQARWQAYQARTKALLEEFIKAEYANLAGRTKREARTEATWKWQQRLVQDRKEELKRRWRNRGAEARLERKAQRKARKMAKRNEKLRNLVLADAPNQVAPPSRRPAATA